MKLSDLLTPVFSAVETRDEDSHRLIRRTCLELVVGTLTLVALATEEPVRRHGPVALQLPLLTNLLLLKGLGPASLKQLVGIHFGNIFEGDLTRLVARK